MAAVADEDDELKLSDHAAAALAEFLAEQNQPENDTVNEDWQLSQFWYTMMF